MDTASKKTILVPVDFQEASAVAIAKARELGARLDLSITLLHVFSIPVVIYPGFDPILSPEFPEKISKAAEEALNKLAAESGGAATLLRSGDPATEILAAIGETKPEMVVMGTHGRRGFSHLLLGSVAEQVVRASTAPVLTLHAPSK